MIKTIGFVEFQNETVVITDPCYIPNPFNVDFISASTIYGDWSCTVFEMSTNKVLGEFCADSGMVCITKLDKILDFNPDWLDWLKEHSHCATLISNFTGKVAIIHADKEYGKECWVEGRGNINFISRQTGL